MPIGPDLRSLTNRSPQALLSAILDPSQSVEPRYLNYNIVLQSGEVLVGVVTAENANSIEVANADGKRRVILRDSIDVIQRSELSAMPAGFETKLTPLDMAHLFAFIGELGQ